MVNSRRGHNTVKAKRQRKSNTEVQMFTYVACTLCVALLFVHSLGVQCRSLNCTRQLAGYRLIRTERFRADGCIERLKIIQEAFRNTLLVCWIVT